MVSLRFRDVTPRGFYARSVLLVLAPMVLLLLGMTYVFFEGHIEQVSRKLSQGVAGDIAEAHAQLVHEENDLRQIETISKLRSTLRITAEILEKPSLPAPVEPPFWRANRDALLAHELGVSLGDTPFWFDTMATASQVEVRIPYGESQTLRLLVDRDRTFATTGHIFIVWVILFFLLVVIVAIGFLRNQVRSVLLLAEAAEAYGRGEDDTLDLKPSGATEVRKAAHAIAEMRERIIAHVDQRTAMLAGVSHDLRTPLTRLKLQLALLPPSEDLDAARKDLDEMAAMLDEYLAFARGQEGEAYQTIDLGDLARDVAMGQAHRIEVTVSSVPKLTLRVRPLAVKRALANLIGNAADYGSAVQVTVTHMDSEAVVIVEDNGHGIDPEHYEDAFKPFSRLDASRNQNMSGVGLGLAVARDVARAHGGDVRLGKAGLGGLRAEFALPLSSAEE